MTGILGGSFVGQVYLEVVLMTGVPGGSFNDRCTWR